MAEACEYRHPAFSSRKGARMKGIVFTEFMNMVEQAFGADMVDELIEATQPASGGVYTAVGYYAFSELAAYIGVLSRQTGQPAAELIHSFGHYLFRRLAQLYPSLVSPYRSVVPMLASLDNTIHVEVHKLYPDVELPSFQVEQQGEHGISLLYSSPRCLSKLAEGLMRGALEHFGEEGDIRLEMLQGDGSEVRIRLELQP